MSSYGTTAMIAAYVTNFTIVVPAAELFKEAVKLLSLGVFSFPDLNGLSRTWIILAGVTWTLRYEWGFYVSLLFLAFAAKSKTSSYLVPMVLGISGLAFILYRPVQDHYTSSYVAWACLFMGGAVSAVIVRSGLTIKPRIGSVALIGIVACLFAFFDRMYFVVPIALATIAFLLIVSGSTLFGLLKCRPARRLGDISYGIYLLQGLVLTCTLSSSFFKSLATASPEGHWVVTIFCGFVLVLLAMAAHVLVERPGILLGKRLTVIAGFVKPKLQTTLIGA